MSQSVPLTRESFDALQEELKRLIREERPKVIQDIAEARAHGDLSENAEYDAAKHRQAISKGPSSCWTSSTCSWGPRSLVPACSTPMPATICEDTAMVIDYLLGGVVTIGLLAYLVFALVRPERF